jgi:hypothetical protein
VHLWRFGYRKKENFVNSFMKICSVSLLILLSLTVQAERCRLQNNSPYSPVGHMSPELELSPKVVGQNTRFVTLSSGAVINLQLVSDSGGGERYSSVDAGQRLSVQTTKVGNAEVQAIVTIEGVLPARYVCDSPQMK